MFSGDTVVSGEQICGGRDHPIVLTEAEKAIVDLVPSYREILSRTPLPIFDGGELLQKTMGKKSIEALPLKPNSRSSGARIH